MMLGYLIAMESTGKTHVVAPTGFMTKDEAEIILEAKKVEYPASAYRYRIVEVNEVEAKTAAVLGDELDHITAPEIQVGEVMGSCKQIETPHYETNLCNDFRPVPAAAEVELAKASINAAGKLEG